VEVACGLTVEFFVLLVIFEKKFPLRGILAFLNGIFMSNLLYFKSSMKRPLEAGVILNGIPALVFDRLN
jgi:hypothetical protein